MMMPPPQQPLVKLEQFYFAARVHPSPVKIVRPSRITPTVMLSLGAMERRANRADTVELVEPGVKSVKWSWPPCLFSQFSASSQPALRAAIVARRSRQSRACHRRRRPSVPR